MSGWAEVYVELYPTESGGRQTPLDLCSDRPGSYRPHFRPLAQPSELIGVEFMDGPDDPVLPGEGTSATVHFLCEYQALALDAEFEIMEGSRAVGRATITRLD